MRSSSLLSDLIMSSCWLALFYFVVMPVLRHNLMDYIAQITNLMRIPF